MRAVEVCLQVMFERRTMMMCSRESMEFRTGAGRGWEDTAVSCGKNMGLGVKKISVQAPALSPTNSVTLGNF